MNIPEIFSGAPFWLKIWAIIGVGAISVPYISNVFRRLNDIFDEINLNIQILFSAFIVLGQIGTFFQIGFLVPIITLVMLLYLIIKSGKITSKYPHDFRKDFNWGAFLGTWIWGLFNKSYLALWQLIIGLTPLGFHYSLFCGLKGNEWAYKNRKYNDEKKFKQSQETQAIVFAVLTFIVLPILYFLIVFIVVFALAFTGAQNAENPTELETTKSNTVTIEENINNLTNTMASIYFESYEIDEHENKFYLKLEDWETYNITEKRDILDLAANISANKKSTIHKESNSTEYKHFSKYNELKMTKIYDVATNKLLAEFIMDDSVFNQENFSMMKAIKSTMKSYKFY